MQGKPASDLSVHLQLHFDKRFENCEDNRRCSSNGPGGSSDSKKRGSHGGGTSAVSASSQAPATYHHHFHLLDRLVLLPIFSMPVCFRCCKLLW